MQSMIYAMHFAESANLKQQTLVYHSTEIPELLNGNEVSSSESLSLCCSFHSNNSGIYNEPFINSDDTIYLVIYWTRVMSLFVFQI